MEILHQAHTPLYKNQKINKKKKKAQVCMVGQCPFIEL